MGRGLEDVRTRQATARRWYQKAEMRRWDWDRGRVALQLNGSIFFFGKAQRGYMA
jgi:hypothetical protein